MPSDVGDCDSGRGFAEAGGGRGVALGRTFFLVCLPRCSRALPVWDVVWGCRDHTLQARSDNTHYFGLHSIFPHRSPNQQRPALRAPGTSMLVCGALVRVAAFAEPHRGLLALRAFPVRLAA